MLGRSLLTFAAVGLLSVLSPVAAQTPDNLLRNADLQDDWLSVLPQNKNHHWVYFADFYNRRDFNPDGWILKGSWDWRDADRPAGQRRLVLRGPGATLRQQVNWCAVHDDRVAGGGSPDMGGFPGLVPQRSTRPERLVGDLTFRVRVKGTNVPAEAAELRLTLAPATAAVKLPSGTFDGKWVEIKLKATEWLAAAKQAADKNAKERAESQIFGTLLPSFVEVQLAYTKAGGELVVERAELLESRRPPAPNLLGNASFESVNANGYPCGWSQPQKYRYFPPGYYYIFNTWHNSRYPNRGLAVADTLVASSGRRSLKMIVASGDETCVVSEPIPLNQKTARLIEVQVRVKHDCLAMLQIDAEDDQGRRLDAFSFIQKAPVSQGTEEWRTLRQMFRPRQPAASVRLKLCARGVNGYTLEDTGEQPQNNVAGTIWWDEVRLTEPASTPQELKERGVKVPSPPPSTAPGPRLEKLDLGERLLGTNVLRATVFNPGSAATFFLRWEHTSPSGKRTTLRSAALAVPAKGRAEVEIPYDVKETCPAYREWHSTLSLLDRDEKPLANSELWFGVWTTPIRINLGALYLRPEQKQFVRLNLGLSTRTVDRLSAVAIDVIDRRTGKRQGGVSIDRVAEKMRAQREKLPKGLRGDFAHLLLADLDVNNLPVQAFDDPQRHFFVRVAARGPDGKVVASVDSPPFCRQAPQAPQPPIRSVKIVKDLLYVNDQPWMPWGVCYGHVPRYSGPADLGKDYLDLRNLRPWNIYDGYTAAQYTRKQNDFNCLRYVAGSITDVKRLEKAWKEDNLYCSSAFVAPHPVFSWDDLIAQFSMKDKLTCTQAQQKLAEYLAFVKTAPMVVASAPGIEEAFGNFHAATPAQLQGLADVVARLRRDTGKPVMVGHGGYFNRFEFEKVPFFDLFDPETEPFYPANVHTDVAPLVRGKDKVIWLRPQMYEDVPYERWRFHVYVELMRGCRGWQIAHGPGDASLFRGLHGELEFLKPIVYAREAGPKIDVEPNVEHWSRRHNGKVYLIAATTRGVNFGAWRWDDEVKSPAGRSRVTEGPGELRNDANAFAIGQKVERGPTIHGLQDLPNVRSWPRGSKVVQWVRLDPRLTPRNLVLLVKTDGRWRHAAAWGKFDVTRLRKDGRLADWFLHSFYHNANGFLGWDAKLVDKALGYIPAEAADQGALPAAGEWVKLEVPLAKFGAAGAPLEGIGFLHEGGRTWWGRTSLVDPEGGETVIWGDSLGAPASRLAKTKIRMAGLKAGTKVRVLFEDRELTAADGYFTDDFRGQDLYQRFGGLGYGSEPVALHVYEVPIP